jgi:hypothetical protein
MHPNIHHNLFKLSLVSSRLRLFGGHEKHFNALAMHASMRSKTHKKIRETIFPNLDPKVLDRIDRRIDKSEPWMPEISPPFGKVPGLSYRGHRKRGHDIITAGAVGLQEAGLIGGVAAETHLGADLLRDQIIKRWGPDAADLFEALLSLSVNVYERHRKNRSRRGRRKVSTHRSR